MQTSTQEQEKLLLQMAIRQASRGRGSTFFHLLFPFSLSVSFMISNGAPMLFPQIVPDPPTWLHNYLMLSPIPTVLVTSLIYSILRSRRLNPIIAKIRLQNPITEEFQ